ncbi:MAG: tetratricopeptide repeat protein [Planctomycetaceae bacterium]|nr:tetratricopeptide repeat protein [Planctomycetaceae bacterium]
MVPIQRRRPRRMLRLFGISGFVCLALGLVVTVALLGTGKPAPQVSAAPKTAAEAKQSQGQAAVADAARGKAPDLTPEQLFEKASPAVVYIVVRDKDLKPLGLGSGFFVDAGGLIVTNFHVIKGAEFAAVRLSSGATLFVDGVVATDPDGDLALLKVSGSGYPCLALSKGGLPKVGAAVFAIGNPQGLENTFSSGMVSGHREIKAGMPAIQVTAPISPGSSGGPLLNAGGEIVGVTTAYLGGGQNLNFAVPVSGVSALMRKQGKVQTLTSAGGRRLDSAETEELDKAWAAIAKKDWGTATSILTSLREKQRDNPVVWYALGQLHAAIGNHDIALQHYQVAIDLKPNYAAAHFNMGLACSTLNRHADAIEAYKQAIAIKPDMAQAYSWMGDAWSKMKCHRDAIEACKKAIAIDPNYALSYRVIGVVYTDLKQYSQAIEFFKKGIAIDPGDNRAYVIMARAYSEMDRHAEAIEACRQALAIAPNYPGAYFRLGASCEKLNRNAEAIEAYEQYLRLEPAGAIAPMVEKYLARVRLAGQ